MGLQDNYFKQQNNSFVDINKFINYDSSNVDDIDIEKINFFLKNNNLGNKNHGYIIINTKSKKVYLDNKWSEYYSSIKNIEDLFKYVIYKDKNELLSCIQNKNEELNERVIKLKYNKTQICLLIKNLSFKNSDVIVISTVLLQNLFLKIILQKDFYSKLDGFVNSYSSCVFQLKYNRYKNISFQHLGEKSKTLLGIENKKLIKDSSLFYNNFISEYSDIFWNDLEKAIETNTNFKFSVKFVSPHKGMFRLEGIAIPYKKVNGEIIWNGYMYDSTMFNGVRDSLSILDKLFKNSQDSIIIVDKDGKIQNVNPAFTQITGYSPQEAIGKNPNILSSGLHNKKFFTNMWSAIKKHGFWQGEIFNRRKNGKIFASLLTIETNYDENIKSYLGVSKDIEEIKEQQNALNRLDNYDYLTNLPNRKFLLNKIEEYIINSNKNNKKFAIILLDIDNFKPINDKLGHHSGDLLLIEISKDLLSNVNENDFVSRLGGDEFVLVIDNFIDDNELISIADKILSTCNKKYYIEEDVVSTSISMGISVYPNVQGSADELIRSADQAMYKAKQKGKKRFVFFDPEQEENSIKHYLKLEELKEALKNQELILWYQPKINAKNNKIVGVEALIRWKKPGGIIVPASEFVDIIYGDELDYKIGCFVIDKCLATQKKWKELGHNFNVSINISPDHLLHPKFEQDLEKYILQYNTNPSTVTIEILEITKITNFDLVLNKLKSCIDLGVNFSLDDFGIGYSSLSYLRAMPTTEVKIDKTFVMSMLNKKEDQLIVSAIVNLSHALGRIVVAEGVETLEHMKKLKELNVDVLQGFGISKPLPEEKVLDWVKYWNNFSSK